MHSELDSYPRVIFVILLMVCQQFVAAENAACFGGRAHGSIVEKGRFFYTCLDGTLEQTGCLGENREQIPVGGTFKLGNYEMRCVMDSDGLLSVDYNACVINGTTVEAGTTYESGHFWFTCYRQGDYVVQELMGCLHNGQRLRKFEKVRENGFIYECRDKHQALAMCPAGCVVHDQDYNIGQLCWDDKLLYSCTTEDGLLKRKVIGCMKDNQQIRDGEKLKLSNQLYRCEVRDTDATLSLVGCLDLSGTEYLFGSHWTETSEGQKYTVECKQRDDSVAVISRLNCLFDGQSNVVRIEPGCFRKVDDQAVGCTLQSSPSSSTTESFINSVIGVEIHYSPPINNIQLPFKGELDLQKKLI